MQVIADFQGAPLDAPSVQDEYKEIRDAVLADVGRSSCLSDSVLINTRELLETDPTRLFGPVIRAE